MVAAAITRSPSTDDEDAPVAGRHLELGERAVVRRARRAALPRAAPAPAGRSARARASSPRASSRATSPSASNRTAASICDEISVRSVEGLGRVHRSLTLTQADTAAQCVSADEVLSEVLRRPRHAPGGDDRLLRARSRSSRSSSSRFALLGLFGRADASDFLVRELQRGLPGELAQEHRQARPHGAGQRGRARDHRRRRFLLWSSLSLFSALESAFNIVYGRPNRPFLHGKALAAALMVGLARRALRRASSSARSASTCSNRYAPGVRAQPGGRVRALDRRVARSRVFVFLARVYHLLTNADADAARRAAGRGRGDARARGDVPGRCRSTSASRATRPPQALRRPGDPARLALRDGERDRARRRGQLVAPSAESPPQRRVARPGRP